MKFGHKYSSVVSIWFISKTRPINSQGLCQAFVQSLELSKEQICSNEIMFRKYCKDSLVKPGVPVIPGAVDDLKTQKCTVPTVLNPSPLPHTLRFMMLFS